MGPLGGGVRDRDQSVECGRPLGAPAANAVWVWGRGGRPCDRASTGAPTQEYTRVGWGVHRVQRDRALRHREGPGRPHH